MRISVDIPIPESVSDRFGQLNIGEVIPNRGRSTFANLEEDRKMDKKDPPAIHYWQTNQDDDGNDADDEEMLVREQVIDIYRLPDRAVPLTDYEKGATFMHLRQVDSALACFARFHAEYPDNISGELMRAVMLFALLRVDEAVAGLEKLAEKYPNNYRVQGHLEGMYLHMYKSTQNEDYRLQAMIHEKRVKELNPVMARGQVSRRQGE